MEGVVYISSDEEYQDGEKWILMPVTLTHYAYAEGFWPDHYIATTETGKHFFLAARDQVK